jgi:hypothetical protein
MAFLDQIIRNWKNHQVTIIFLILFLIFLVLFKTVSNKKEEFTNGSSDNAQEISFQTLRRIFFINSFQKQDFVKIWETKTDDNTFISFWRREKFNDYYPIGHIVLKTTTISGINDIKQTEHEGLKYLVKGGENAVDFEKIWDNKNVSSQDPVSIWKVITPSGYVAMSDVVVPGYDKPSDDIIKCLPLEVLSDNEKINDINWKYPTPQNKTDDGEDISPPNSLSVWNVGNQKFSFFFARDSYQKPLTRTDKIKTIKTSILNNQETDPDDSGKILKVTLKV